VSLPRVMRGITASPMSHERHLEIHGELPRGAGRASGLGAELTRATLRGRGGGGFPLGRKLEAVHRRRGTPVVVVNGCEGEPMSVKDRLLLQSLPHLVLDGALGCARALGTDEIVVAIEETSVLAVDALRRAATERSDMSGALEVVELPSGYVSGQETAVVAYLNGGAAVPAHAAARVTERGVAGRPTLVANAETLAHAALIARYGADWFRQLGTTEEPGSVLVTVGGGVRSPGVCEIEYGSRLSSVLSAAGGLAEPARAFLIGGYAGSWIDSADASVYLDRAGLAALGAGLGAGIIVALPQSACPVAEVTRVAGWMAAQSTRQCGPCSNGLSAIAEALLDTCEGVDRPGALHDVRRWAAQVTGRGACAHPDGTARFVASAVSLFAGEFEDHARHGVCDACGRRPVLTTPTRAAAVI
jgi:NADH:ubiquinone oxidoreductase subunit F (NADH-binding)